MAMGEVLVSDTCRCEHISSMIVLTKHDCNAACCLQTNNWPHHPFLANTYVVRFGADESADDSMMRQHS
jgi:hypothetical protein